MRRSSILDLMGLVALLAASLALGRYLLTREDNLTLMALTGLLPLLDAQLVAVYLVLWGNWVAIHRLAGRFVPVFAFVSSLALMAAFLVCLLAPKLFKGLIEWSWSELDDYLPLDAISDGWANLVMAASLCAVVSLPPLLLSLVVAAVMSRFQPVNTPRSASRSQAD